MTISKQSASQHSRTANAPAASTATPNGDYADLRRQARAAGLLEPALGYYWSMVALVAGLCAAGFALIALWPGPGDVLAVFVLALTLVQGGFVGHDAGHNQVFEKTRHNRLLGLLTFTLFLGASFEFWTRKHNRHHSRTNEAGEDPDITGQFFAFTPEQAAERKGLMRWIVRNQGSLFFLLTTMATVGFRVDAWRTSLGNLDEAYGRRELAALVVNVCLWFVLPSLVFGPVHWLLLFVAVHMVAGVYMTSVFAPNHKGMPLIAGKRPSFLVQQVATSRNVHGPGALGQHLVDFLYGGLNYQIEHHLFPTMPRCRLGTSERLVKEYCASIGLSHEETGVIDSFRHVLGALNAAGRGEEPAVVAG